MGHVLQKNQRPRSEGSKTIDRFEGKIGLAVGWPRNCFQKTENNDWSCKRRSDVYY
jgi:hypothetical protein